MVGWRSIRAIISSVIQSQDSPSNEEVDISRLITRVGMDPVARGGTSDLYLGRHKTLGKVALRRMRNISFDQNIIRRFHREVDLLRRVKHEHILPFLGTCTIGPDFYMVSPYMKNGDLKSWMDQGHNVVSSRILYQVAGAITHLHLLNLVHGDIKAQNVLLADDETARLCDFGLAKALDTMVTSADAKGRGSARWMAPELFEAQPKTKESDIYAFGMMIVEVLTRKPPFFGIFDYAIASQVLFSDTRPMRPETFGQESDGKLWDLAEKCWAKHPKDRPMAGSLASEIVLEEGLGSSVKPLTEQSTRLDIDSKATDNASTLSRESIANWDQIPARDLSREVRLKDTKPVASGGFCRLYEGYDETRTKKVALRRPIAANDGLRAVHDFTREVKLWHQLSHRNILPLLGKCIIGQHVYTVSPFMEKGNLFDFLRTGHDIDRCSTLYQVADAIAYLHASEIIHGDIKAENVLISDNHTPLLCDFGLAKGVNWVTPAEAQCMGSTRWMAPELFREEKKSVESDVYAFGIMIAEVLSGEVPFGDVINEAVLAHQVLYNDKRPPRRPLLLDGRSLQACWDVAERCWAKEPSKRPFMIHVLQELGHDVKCSDG